jgi:hypothetical protein
VARPLTTQDLLDPAVLSELREQLLARLGRGPATPRLLENLMRIHRALGDIEAAAACASHAAVGGGTAAAGSQPAPCLRLLHVLSPLEQAALWNEVETLRPRFAPSEVKWRDGRGVEGSVRHSLRAPAGGGLTRILLPALRGAVQEHGLGAAFGISASLELDRAEAEVVSHLGGGLFAAHADAEYGDRGRLLSCVYYFQRQPRAFTGGDLLLHDRAMQGSQNPVSFTRFRPVDNSAVLFAASTLHEVSPVNCDCSDPLGGRLSVNVWFHGAQP